MPYSAPSEQARRIIEVLDYQGRSEGAELAEWVTLYINGGDAALEKMSEFDGYYVFAAEQSSSSLETLLQWADNFSVEQDIPLLIFLRVYRRFTSNLSVNPDEIYGNFFEAVIKRAATLKWAFARKYAETWILARRVALPVEEDDSETEDAVNTTQYMYLIINTIEKTEVQSALKLVMDSFVVDKTYTRDKVQAINAVKSNFFDAF